MPYRHSRALASLGLSCIFAVALAAQSTPRDLAGTVTDAHKEPLAGAVVEVHDENTDTVASYITNRSGRYVFLRLSSDDDYTVFATYRGARSRTRRLSKFDSKPRRNISLVVRVP